MVTHRIASWWVSSVSMDCTHPTFFIIRPVYSGLFELLNYIITSIKCLAYTIHLFEPHWHVAAGATIAYSVKIVPALDQGMYQSILMTLQAEVDLLVLRLAASICFTKRRAAASGLSAEDIALITATA
jgi:hypothetical protein